MTRLLDRLHEDHGHLSRLLDLLDRLLDRFHEGTEPDYELMCEMLKYMESYADQIHHPTEDLIFERMLEKGGGNMHILEVLMRQHEAVHEINKQFQESLEGVVHEAVIRRDLVEAHGRDLVKTLRKHLQIEEQEAFPMARKLLTKQDWEELDKKASDEVDPVFGDRDPTRFRALYRHLVEQAQS